jgi:hypothetical protein
MCTKEWVSYFVYYAITPATEEEEKGNLKGRAGCDRFATIL